MVSGIKAINIDEYVSRLLYETYVSLDMIYKLCGDFYVTVLNLLKNFVADQLILCKELSDTWKSILCYDILESHNNLILLLARGDVGIAAVIARRLLEEVSAMTESTDKYYNVISRLIVSSIASCEETSEESSEELEVKLKKILRDGLQKFLCGFTHPVGKGLKQFLGSIGKPPILETDPKNLCMSIEAVLSAILTSIVAVHLTQVIIFKNRNYINNVLSTVSEVLRSQITEKYETLKAIAEGLVLVANCISNATTE